jgi:transposase-like protein
LEIQVLVQVNELTKEARVFKFPQQIHENIIYRTNLTFKFIEGTDFIAKLHVHFLDKTSVDKIFLTHRTTKWPYAH